MKADNLVINDCENLILTAWTTSLKILLPKREPGMNLNIHLNKLSKRPLQLVLLQDDDNNVSTIYVTGEGELNTYDYPTDKIVAESATMAMKKIYFFVICMNCKFKDLCNSSYFQRELR